MNRTASQSLASGHILSEADDDSARAANKVFLITPFGDARLLRVMRATIRDVLEHHGLELTVADERMISKTGDLWGNVREHMEGAARAIAVFIPVDGRYFNPNVSLELGYMLAGGKDVLLLKERKLKQLQTDVIGFLYREFSARNAEVTVRAAVMDWLVDIGVRKHPGQKRILFVSYGGTCRCAMAKVVLNEELKGRKLPFDLQAMSVAQEYGHSRTASDGAREAIRKHFKEDLLAEHIVTKLSPGLAEEADLVVPMSRSILKRLPKDVRSKAVLFTKLFKGIEGDIANPYKPTRGDNKERRARRYQSCLAEIRDCVEPHVEKLLVALKRNDSSEVSLH
ncbi:MAG: hypothetical protein WDN08_09870 [Rhizomicrobium sp.]